jgi:hypothetical protein
MRLDTLHRIKTKSGRKEFLRLVNIPKTEFTKLSDEQSQARLSYAMTMSKSRKSDKFPIYQNI